MSKEMTFVEPMTKKRITYTEDAIFSIYLRYENKPARVHRFYSFDKIGEALKDFYDLDLSKSYRKYFYFHKDTHHLARVDGEILINLKCHSDKTVSKLKRGNELKRYRKQASVNLIQTPETLAIKLDETDYTTFPTIEEKWSKQLLTHSLLAYFYTLDKESQETLARRSYMALVAEKIASAV